MKAPKNYWLLKSEPGAYSIDDLNREKKTAWTGIRNYQARNFIRDSMQPGDLCLFYHSNSDPMGVVGVARVVGKPYPDPTQFDIKNHYFDPKSSPKDPIWMLVDIAFVKKFKHCVTLAEIKSDPALEGMMLRRRARLSVQPVSEKHFGYISQELA